MEGIQISRARDLDLDLGSGHTAYRRASLIDLYLHTKFHSDRKKLFVDGRTDGRTFFPSNIIRSTFGSRPKNDVFPFYPVPLHKSRWSLPLACNDIGLYGAGPPVHRCTCTGVSVGLLQGLPVSQWDGNARTVLIVRCHGRTRMLSTSTVQRVLTQQLTGVTKQCVWRLLLYNLHFRIKSKLLISVKLYQLSPIQYSHSPVSKHWTTVL